MLQNIFAESLKLESESGTLESESVKLENETGHQQQAVEMSPPILRQSFLKTYLLKVKH